MEMWSVEWYELMRGYSVHIAIELHITVKSSHRGPPRMRHMS